MKFLLLALITLSISQSALAVVINLDSEIRTTPSANGCNFGERQMVAEYKFYKDPNSDFEGYIGYVVFKPKFVHPERIPTAGIDLSKAKDVVFPADPPKNCEFKGTVGVIHGTEEDEVGILFLGTGCEPVINIFKENKFSELGLEWSAVKTADEQDHIDTLTMTIINPKQVCQ